MGPNSHQTEILSFLQFEMLENVFHSLRRIVVVYVVVKLLSLMTFKSGGSNL
jgi:hypothetical protein